MSTLIFFHFKFSYNSKSNRNSRLKSFTLSNVLMFNLHSLFPRKNYSNVGSNTSNTVFTFLFGAL